MKAPYFDLDDLFFQTKENPVVRTLNLETALKVLRKFVLEGGHREDAEIAMNYLVEQNPHIAYLMEQLKGYLFLDEELVDNYSRRMCAYFFNLIGDKVCNTRLNNRS